MDDGGRVLTLKQCPRMALIRPHVDLTRGSLTLTFDAPPPCHQRDEQTGPGGAQGHAQGGGPKGPADEPLRIAIPRFREWEERRRRGRQGCCGTTEAGAEGRATAGGAGGPGAGLQGGRSSGGGREGQGGDPVVRLDAGLTMERVRVCGDAVCSDVVSGQGAVGGGKGWAWM